MFIVVILSGKSDCVDFFEARPFCDYKEAQCFCDSVNTGKAKHWCNAFIANESQTYDLQEFNPNNS